MSLKIPKIIIIISTREMYRNLWISHDCLNPIYIYSVPKCRAPTYIIIMNTLSGHNWQRGRKYCGDFLLREFQIISVCNFLLNVMKTSITDGGFGVNTANRNILKKFYFSINTKCLLFKRSFPMGRINLLGNCLCEKEKLLNDKIIIIRSRLFIGVFQHISVLFIFFQLFLIPSFNAENISRFLKKKKKEFKFQYSFVYFHGRQTNW